MGNPFSVAQKNSTRKSGHTERSRAKRWPERVLIISQGCPGFSCAWSQMTIPLEPVHFPLAWTTLNLGFCHLSQESLSTQPLIFRTTYLTHNGVATQQSIPQNVPFFLQKALTHLCYMSGQSGQAPGFFQVEASLFWHFFLSIWLIRLWCQNNLEAHQIA